MFSRTTSGLLAVPLVAVLGFAGVRVATDHSAAAAKSTSVTISKSTVGPKIPSGFVGLSMEYRGFASYAGTNPKAPSPVFEQILKNIAPNQSPVLRIGGDGTDWTWYPVAGVAQPGGVKYSITKDYLGTVKTIAQALNARVIMGVNLEANNTRIAGGEASAIVSQVGSKYIQGLEIGNEPELYGSFSWYKNAQGQHVKGRPSSYNFDGFLGDFARMAHAIPSAPLAGPSSGSPNYMAHLGQFLGSEPRVRVATIHRYPLKHCGTQSVSTGDLLSDNAAEGLSSGVSSFVSVAHSHRVPLRIDEMNAISCGGQRGVSDSFASALWATDALFAMARAGVDGVNFHTVPNTINELVSSQFTHGHWQAYVHPQYYGMMLFAQAAPAGARFLRMSGPQASGVHVWATHGTDGKIRVTIINKNQGGSPAVTKLRLPSSGPGTVERMQARSVHATSGVTLGGQSFGSNTTTGLLAGQQSSASVSPSGGVYSVTVPAASAALLTVG